MVFFRFGYILIKETAKWEYKIMSTGAILLILFIVLLIATLPTWPYSRSWGYFPGGIIGLILLILLILLLMGRL